MKKQNLLRDKIFYYFYYKNIEILFKYLNNIYKTLL
jgi:hypothetical protein